MWKNIKWMDWIFLGKMFFLYLSNDLRLYNRNNSNSFWNLRSVKRWFDLCRQFAKFYLIEKWMMREIANEYVFKIKTLSQDFPTGRMGGFPHQSETCFFSLPGKIRLSRFPPTIPILTSYSLYAQVMVILLLIDAQYLQHVNCSFEKGLNGQNHSSSGYQHPIKKLPPVKFPILLPKVVLGTPSLLNTIWKTLLSNNLIHFCKI